MPEVHFRIRWPDGSTRECYSPSTVIHEHLTTGETLALDAFLEKARAGLDAASARVAMRYGQSCSRAAAEIATLERLARDQPGDGDVTIESMQEPGELR